MVMMDDENSKPGLSRRQTLRAISGAGLSFGLGGLGLLPGAVLGQPSPSPMTGAPRRGGSIRVASLSSSTADTLDPAKGALSTDYVRHYMVYSGLTQYDENLNARLALAESLESHDQTLWNIKLRQGVEFHDGKALTAEDVVYSLQRHKIPETASKLATVAQQFEDIRAVGKHEVRLQLAGPNVDLPLILADSHFLIVPAGATDLGKGIGTGPYRLESFQPGVRTIVVRNDKYWKSGAPHLERIELIGIPDEPSRVNALLSGDVQLVIAVNPRSTRRITESPEFDVLETPSGLYTNLIMRQDTHPTNNPDFILAMKYLFDRELIKRALFRGFATVANDHPVTPGNRYFAANLPQRQYDPERALFHLNKSGMAGARLPIFASPAATGSVDMAALLQLSASKVGLNLSINRVPGDGYWSNHWMKHPLGFGNVNPRASLDLLFSQFFKSDAPWNESGWSNPQFDQLLVAARGEGAESVRKQMYTDMQVLIHQHCGMGIPVFMSLIDGFDRRLKGLGPIPIGGLMGYSFAEHVWWEE